MPTLHEGGASVNCPKCNKELTSAEARYDYCLGCDPTFNTHTSARHDAAGDETILNITDDFKQAIWEMFQGTLDATEKAVCAELNLTMRLTYLRQRHAVEWDCFANAATKTLQERLTAWSERQKKNR
jgi:hypothetical protein